MRTLISKHPWASAGTAALLVLLVVMATAIVRASYVSPEQRLTASTEDLVRRAFSAEPAAMDQLFEVSSVGTVQLLTKETAAVAMGPSPSFEVVSAGLTDKRTFEVVGTLHTAPGPVGLTITYERTRESDPWVLQQLRPPSLLLSVYPLRGEVSINGVKIGDRALATVSYATWPGQARVSADGLEDQDVRLLAALSAESSYQRTIVKLAPPSGAIDDAELAAALEQKLRSCLGPADLSRVECVFSPPGPPAGSTSVRKVEFSHLRLGDSLDRLPQGSLSASGTQEGTVLVTGQWLSASGWTDFSTRTAFSYDFVATAGADGLIVETDPDRGSAPYETNAAWGRALTDRGSTDAND